MKFRSFLLTILTVSSLCFAVHRNYQLIVPNNKPTVSLTIDAQYAKDDIFQLFYTTDEDESFSEIKSKSFVIKGSPKNQIIKFQLPPFSKVRFDYSNNREQHPIELNSITIVENKKEFEIQPNQFSTYLKANKHTSLDSINGIHPQIIEGTYDPALTLNKSPIIFSIPDKSDSKTSPFYLLLFCLFLFACYSLHPLSSVLFKFQTINDINRLQWFLIAFSILIIKGFTKIYFSDIWAEDGKVFLQQSFQMGPIAIFNSYSGYYHTLPRLLTQFISFFPALFIPFLISISCYTIYALVLVEIVRKEYDWIIKDQWIKLILILLWCFNPGIDEVVGNLSNLHWLLLTFLGLLSLRNVERNYSIFDIVIAFLCISSEGAVLIFLPVFAFRAILKYMLSKELKSSKGELIILGLIILFSILNFTIRDNQSSISLSTVQLEVWYQSFTSHFIMAPILGDYFTFELMRTPTLFIISSIFFTIALTFFIYKYWSHKNLLLYILLGSVTVLPVMISMARYTNTEVLLNFFNFHENWWCFRYAFFLPFFGVICWIWIVSKQNNILVKRIAFAFLLFVSLFLNKNRFFNKPLGFERVWINNAEKIDKTRSGTLQKVLVLPIHPAGWEIEIKPISSK
jgi:hypothetical protein